MVWNPWIDWLKQKDWCMRALVVCFCGSHVFSTSWCKELWKQNAWQEFYYKTAHPNHFPVFFTWLEGHSQVPCHFNLHKMCQLEPALKGVAVTIPSHSCFSSTQAPTPTAPLYQPHPPENPGTLCFCDFVCLFISKHIIGQLCKVHRDDANRAKGFQTHWLAL